MRKSLLAELRQDHCSIGEIILTFVILTNTKQIKSNDYFPHSKLTDKPKDEKSEAATPAIAEINFEEIGKGNNHVLPIFKTASLGPNENTNKIVPTNDEVMDTTPVKQESYKDDEINKIESNDSKMVVHKGALIDIEKLLQQMARSEKAREETEIRLVELTKANAELQSSNSKSKDKVKDLQSELKNTNRKLTEAETNLSSANVSFYFLTSKK